MIVESVLDDKFSLTKGKRYLVIEMSISLLEKRISYSIMRDNDYISPIIVDSANFVVTDNSIPPNWIFDTRKTSEDDIQFVYLAPAPFLDNTPWEFSFWESFHEGHPTETPKAEKIFWEEYNKIAEFHGFPIENR